LETPWGTKGYVREIGRLPTEERVGNGFGKEDERSAVATEKGKQVVGEAADSVAGGRNARAKAKVCKKGPFCKKKAEWGWGAGKAKGKVKKGKGCASKGRRSTGELLRKSKQKKSERRE